MENQEQLDEFVKKIRKIQRSDYIKRKIAYRKVKSKLRRIGKVKRTKQDFKRYIKIKKKMETRGKTARGQKLTTLKRIG